MEHENNKNQNTVNSTRTVCPACDFILDLPQYKRGYRCACPCCNHTLRTAFVVDDTQVASVAFFALVLLACSIFEPFMSLEAMGLGQKISLASIFFSLKLDWTFLIWIFLIVTFVCPTIVLTILVIIGWFKYRPSRIVASIYSTCHHFCMVDVFAVGIAVSLVKLTALVDVSFYSGFYTAILFSFALIWCCIKRSPHHIWNYVMHSRLDDATTGKRAIDQGIYQCRQCHFAFRSNGPCTCPRCGSQVYARSYQWQQRIYALLACAIILFLPANIYPIMYTEMMGDASGSNIVEGAITLWAMGSYFVASVILFASLMIPSFKIIAILIITYRVSRSQNIDCTLLSRCYRLVEFIGKWSMIDVFVVILMSAAVQIGGFLMIYPGLAIIYFCLVVLITIYAAEAFDERLIWDKKDMYASN